MNVGLAVRGVITRLPFSLLMMLIVRWSLPYPVFNWFPGCDSMRCVLVKILYARQGDWVRRMQFWGQNTREMVTKLSRSFK